MVKSDHQERQEQQQHHHHSHRKGDSQIKRTSADGSDVPRQQHGGFSHSQAKQTIDAHASLTPRDLAKQRQLMRSWLIQPGRVRQHNDQELSVQDQNAFARTMQGSSMYGSEEKGLRTSGGSSDDDVVAAAAAVCTIKGQALTQTVHHDKPLQTSSDAADYLSDQQRSRLQCNLGSRTAHDHRQDHDHVDQDQMLTSGRHHEHGITTSADQHTAQRRSMTVQQLSEALWDSISPGIAARIERAYHLWAGKCKDTDIRVLLQHPEQLLQHLSNTEANNGLGYSWKTARYHLHYASQSLQLPEIQQLLDSPDDAQRLMRLFDTAKAYVCDQQRVSQLATAAAAWVQPVDASARAAGGAEDGFHSICTGEAAAAAAAVVDGDRTNRRLSSDDSPTTDQEAISASRKRRQRVVDINNISCQSQQQQIATSSTNLVLNAVRVCEILTSVYGDSYRRNRCMQIYRMWSKVCGKVDDLRALLPRLEELVQHLTGQNVFSRPAYSSKVARDYMCTIKHILTPAAMQQQLQQRQVMTVLERVEELLSDKRFRYVESPRKAAAAAARAAAPKKRGRLTAAAKAAAAAAEGDNQFYSIQKRPRTSARTAAAQQKADSKTSDSKGSARLEYEDDSEYQQDQSDDEADDSLQLAAALPARQRAAAAAATAATAEVDDVGESDARWGPRLPLNTAGPAAEPAPAPAPAAAAPAATKTPQSAKQVNATAVRDAASGEHQATLQHQADNNQQQQQLTLSHMKQLMDTRFPVTDRFATDRSAPLFEMQTLFNSGNFVQNINRFDEFLNKLRRTRSAGTVERYCRYLLQFLRLPEVQLMFGSQTEVQVVEAEHKISRARQQAQQLMASTTRVTAAVAARSSGQALADGNGSTQLAAAKENHAAFAPAAAVRAADPSFIAATQTGNADSAAVQQQQQQPTRALSLGISHADQAKDNTAAAAALLRTHASMAGKSITANKSAAALTASKPETSAATAAASAQPAALVSVPADQAATSAQPSAAAACCSCWSRVPKASALTACSTASSKTVIVNINSLLQQLAEQLIMEEATTTRIQQQAERYDYLMITMNTSIKALQNPVQNEAAAAVLSWLLLLPSGSCRELMIDMLRTTEDWLDKLLLCWSAEVQLTGCAVQQAEAAAKQSYAVEYTAGCAATGSNGRCIKGYLAGSCQLMLNVLGELCKAYCDGDMATAATAVKLSACTNDLLTGTNQILLKSHSDHTTCAGHWRNCLILSWRQCKADKSSSRTIPQRLQAVLQQHVMAARP